MCIRDRAWSEVKSYDEGGNALLVPILLVIAVAVIVIVLWRKSVKKKRNDY